MVWARHELDALPPVRQAPPRFLRGVLCVPRGAFGIVLIVRGASPQPSSGLWHATADALRQCRLGTCMVDLVDPHCPDEQIAAQDPEFLEQRLEAALDYLSVDPQAWRLPLGVLAADRMAGAAISLALRRPGMLAAVVSWCGRIPQPAGELAELSTPTALLVPGRCKELIENNEPAFAAFDCPSQLAVVLGASPSFSEAGTLVAAHMVVQEWFEQFLLQAWRDHKDNMLDRRQR